MKAKWMKKLQNKIPLLVGKVENNKFLIALRGSFNAITSIVVIGSLSVLANTLLLGMYRISKVMLLKWWIDINNLIFEGSISIIALIFIFSLGYNIAKIYKVNPLSTGIVAFSAFVIASQNVSTQSLRLSHIDEIKLAQLLKKVTHVKIHNNIITIQSLLPNTQINFKGCLAAIIIGFLASIVFCKLSEKKWSIKLPKNFPPAVLNSFLSIVPGFLSLTIVAILSYVFNQVTNLSSVTLIYEMLQIPLLNLFQNVIIVVLIAVMTQFLWFFNIHGGNVMAPITEGVFGMALLANLEAYQKHEVIPYIWTNISYNAFTWYATLGLLIAIFWQSKNKHYLEVAADGLTPILFNIGEPVMYGLPIILNPILFTPFLLCPFVLTLTAYLATWLGWVSPVTQNVVWVMPPILTGFLTTAFDWRSIVLSLINLILSIFIYLPFVRLANKIYKE